MKKIFLAAVFSLMPLAAEACSVCFGNPDAPMTKALQVGILVLLGILAMVLAGFAAFFLNLRKKARQTGEGELQHGL